MALSDANSSILDTPDKTILSTGNTELDKKIAD
ncbi:MAG: flagellar accessory protein FlaH, partial [Methanoculleus bourgensis]|nr:flagellar accessory protein FlaH [Methanoculleus bourgensis]